MYCRVLGVFRFLLLWRSASSFSLRPPTNTNLNRRSALSNIITIPAVTSILTLNPFVAKSEPTDTSSSNVCTVVIDSPESSSNVGIQFVDTTIGSKDFATVDKVEPDSLASKSGVKQGMVLLGRESATKSSSKNIEFRLRNGPYPFILQFTTPEKMLSMLSSNSYQQQAQERALGPYDRLDVKVIQKPGSCGSSARRGDTVTISYEARISSSNGPIYDSTSWRQGDPATFELGKGAALPGVDIGVNGMCVGEVREIDMPTTLGYGKFGSQVFDIPGDVRLWWRVQLVDLIKGEKRYKIL